MNDFISSAMRELPTGLSLHYPLLNAIMHGLHVRRSLEFGVGGSTRVIVAALPRNGVHTSIAIESPEMATERSGVLPGPLWVHLPGPSRAHRGHLLEPLDLVLHDGAHDAETVAEDIAWAWPALRRYGLLLVHDSQHSLLGEGVRAGILEGLRRAGAAHSMTTLPYGFGLTLIRREQGGVGEVEPAPAKTGSPHTTVPR